MEQWRRLGYIAAFDAIRGVEIALGLLARFSRLAGWKVEVDPFLGFSGPLITALLREEREARGGSHGSPAASSSLLSTGA
jgi:hypothetical protein